jgi:uncharacterized membrane protein HdeD (DUF308 family)
MEEIQMYILTKDRGNIMDTKLSCLVKGLIGVIFGSLALIVPELTLNTFITLFLVLVGLALIICIFLAITSHSEGSFFWFLAGTVLVIVGICSLIFKDLVAILFLVAIAALAFYSGLEGILLALTRPRSKYYLIGGTVVIAIILLILIIIYVPSLVYDPILLVLGVFSLVFGMFSILMGIYFKEEPVGPAAIPQSKPADLPKEKE